MALARATSPRITSGHYDFVFAGTTCETFSRARAGPLGPRPLRDSDRLCGLPKEQEQLSRAEYEQ
eukprot:15465865-Alexandrium_andersonii.AAC.1